MKKIFVLMLALISFVGCYSDSDIEVPSMWNEIEMKMEKTDLSALEVLKSADYWVATKEYCYTLPNGEGEEWLLHDLELGITKSGGTPYKEGTVVTSDNIWKECYSAHSYGLYDLCCDHVLPRHYKEMELEVTDGIITAIKVDGKSYSFNVVAYDEKSVLIESTLWGTMDYGTGPDGKAVPEKPYPYGRFLFERQTAESPDWEKQYDVDGDEWIKNHEETCEGWQEYINQ